MWVVLGHRELCFYTGLPSTVVNSSTPAWGLGEVNFGSALFINVTVFWLDSYCVYYVLEKYGMLKRSWKGQEDLRGKSQNEDRGALNRSLAVASDMPIHSCISETGLEKYFEHNWRT